MTGFTENYTSTSQALPNRRPLAIFDVLNTQLMVTWEQVLIGFIFVASLITRFWNLGARVMSHDESLHVYYSWLLATGKGFAHNPMMHGPSLFEFTALMNVLFGASDFSSRLVPAILGTFIVVAVPQMLKPWIGRWGALAASSFLLISPFVLYFSRYIRHDIQVIAWLLLAVTGIFSYLQDRRQIHLVLLAAGLALMLSTMEIAFFYLAILATFLAWKLLRTTGFTWSRVRERAEFDLLVVISTLGAFFSSPILLLILNPLWGRIKGAAFVSLETLNSQSISWATGETGVRLWILFGLFSFAATVLGLWWGGRRWLQLAAIFGSVTLVLYTTFGTNPAGAATGFIGSLGYWLAQQDVARGSQPWYYYLIVFPLYEYLPLTGGAAAALFYAWKRKCFSPATTVFVPFLIWWSVAIFLGLTLAGEKMPWLSVHISVPLLLLTGWFVGQFLADEQGLSPMIRGLGLGGVALLSLLTLRTTLAANYTNYDYTTEYIDYAHGAPGVKWVVEDIREIASHTGKGRELRIAFDSEVSWPMNWYLRDFPNQVFFGEQPARQSLDADVVLAGPKNWTRVESILRNRYHRFEVIRLWWPIEDYKNLNWERIQNAVTDPGMRAALWDIFWQRDYTRYAQETGQVLDPPTIWPLAEKMRVYVRQEIAAQMLGLDLSVHALNTLPVQEDPFEKVMALIEPDQLFSGIGLSSPRGIASAPDGSLYIADTGNSRILQVDPTGVVLRVWGSRSPDGEIPPPPGTFIEPWGLALDQSGNVYVADTWNHRIQKFDSAGNFLLSWGYSGLLDEGNDRFWGPRDVAIGRDGKVYVTDTGNKRIAVFDEAGQFLFNFGMDGDGTVDEPVGIAVSAEGRLYVADTWNQRVAIFSPEGVFQEAWPVEAWASSSTDNKPFLAVNSEGKVYVSDPEGYRVLVFSAEGKPVTAFGQYGDENNAFGLPVGVILDQENRVWVVDSTNNRLARFSIEAK
jgi:uncharacterized protein (TIGR03663 family)